MQRREPLVCGKAFKLYMYAIKYIWYAEPPHYDHIIILFFRVL